MASVWGFTALQVIVRAFYKLHQSHQLLLEAVRVQQDEVGVISKSYGWGPSWVWIFPWLPLLLPEYTDQLRPPSMNKIFTLWNKIFTFSKIWLQTSELYIHAHVELSTSAYTCVHRNTTRIMTVLLQSPNHGLGHMCSWDESAQICFYFYHLRI